MVVPGGRVTAVIVNDDSFFFIRSKRVITDRIAQAGRSASWYICIYHIIFSIDFANRWTFVKAIFILGQKIGLMCLFPDFTSFEIQLCSMEPHLAPEIIDLIFFNQSAGIDAMGFLNDSSVRKRSKRTFTFCNSLRSICQTIQKIIFSIFFDTVGRIQPDICFFLHLLCRKTDRPRLPVNHIFRIKYLIFVTAIIIVVHNIFGTI